VRLARAALQTAFAVSDELGGRLAERMFVTPRRHARPERERAILASAREVTFDVTLRAPGHRERRRLAAWRWGFGPPVLLVHGWEGRGSQLGAFVEPLVAAGLSVVAFDAPGHGDSPGDRLYLTDLADCIADVAAAIGALHGIIAHSFGAAGVLLAGARNGLAAPRHVMIAPNVLIDEALERFAGLVGLDRLDRELLERRLAAHTGVSIDALAVDRLTAGRQAALLVVHDEGDREVPILHAERLVAAWPNAQLRKTHELGHRKILRDPAVIAEAVGVMREGVVPPRSDLVREVDRWLDGQQS
jgi:pimeloyl-ACP methyl ester carboxylesterase